MVFVGKFNTLAVAPIVLCEDSAIYISEVVTLISNVKFETIALGFVLINIDDF